MRFKFNKQDGIKDCGVCCLHNIIKYYGGFINFEKLRKMANTSNEGTSVLDLVKVANKIGLKSNAYNCEYNLLKKQSFPLIAHIKVNQIYSHYIIIYKIQKDIIYIFDPIRGYLKYKKELFLKEWTKIIITFKKTDNLIKEKNNYKNKIYFWIFHHKVSFIFISLISLVVSFLTICNSINIGKVLDNNISKYKFIYVVIFILTIILNYIKNNYVIKLNYKFDKDIMSNIFKHIINLPMSYHHNRPAGDIVSRIYDIYYIKEFINEFFLVLLFEIILVIISLLYILFKDFYLFFIVIICSYLFFLTYYFFRNKINNLLQKVQQSHSEVNSEMVETLIGIDSIKNLGLEKDFCNKHNHIYNDYLDNDKKLNVTINNYSLTKEFIKFTCVILSIMFVYTKYNNGFTLTTYIINLQLFDSYNKIINIDNLLIKAKNSYRRINDLLSLKEEKNEKSLTFNDNIHFKNFYYSYNKNIDLNINKNDFILITGKSGVGKSTIFKSLTKQVNNNPNIYLDNKKLSKFSISYIRKKICYVSQNEYIFTDTIINNILMNKKINENELNKILKICMIDKILENRNIDLNYVLEENGHNLSGGERQKILLARTLVKDSDFIILDETMNEIDVESERKILEKIHTEYDKTLILISHRLDNKDLFNKCITVN